MATTIQISTDLQKELIDRKLYDGESYEDVIWDAIEDSQTLSEETKKELAQVRREIAEGRVETLEKVKKEIE